MNTASNSHWTSLVHDYIIRGWITGIKKGYVAGTENHYFGMELGYDKAASVAGTNYTTPAFNGKIAGTIWKSAGDGVNRKSNRSRGKPCRPRSKTFSPAVAIK